MNTNEILAALDAQISDLRKAREILVGDKQHSKPAKKTSTTAGPTKRLGRPKGSGGKKVSKVGAATAKAGKGTMSMEGRARIAAAQKARWAATKAEKSVKSPSKKSAPVPAHKKAATKAAVSIPAKKSAKKSAAAKKSVTTETAPTT